jgi:hypothetical protein
MEKRINFPMEIPPSSAHGIPLHVDLDSLGLQYIFRDSGRSITKFLGDSAARFEYSSPTNFIDTAPVDTTKMNKEFLNKPIITIASPDTLKRFGFKLTTGINMYNRSAGGSFPQVHDVTIPQNTVYLITFHINGSAIPGVTPISNPIVMAFDRDHVQIDIEEYRRAYAISFNPGNDAKNERIKILLDAEEDNREQIFLKYFLIEVKLLGDTNHCMFSRELIGGTAAPSQLVGGESIMPFNPTPTDRNIAFGTCDYDLTLRFILEGVNVFYKEGVCTKYYTGKMMNPFERLIYINENMMSLIHKFKEYLDMVRPDVVMIYNDILTISKFLDAMMTDPIQKTQELSSNPNKYNVALKPKFKLWLYLDVMYTGMHPVLLKKVFEITDRIYVFSETAKKHMKMYEDANLYGKLPDIRVQEHAVDEAVYFSPKETKFITRFSLGVPKDGIVFLNCNRNSGRKRLDTSVMAFAFLTGANSSSRGTSSTAIFSVNAKMSKIKASSFNPASFSVDTFLFADNVAVGICLRATWYGMR